MIKTVKHLVSVVVGCSLMFTLLLLSSLPSLTMWCCSPSGFWRAWAGYDELTISTPTRYSKFTIFCLGKLFTQVKSPWLWSSPYFYLGTSQICPM